MSSEQVELLKMAVEILITMMLSGALAAWFFRHVFNWALIIGMFIVSIVLIFVSIPVSQSGNVPVIFFISMLFGASVAADFGGFALILGQERGLSPKTTFKGVGIAFGITSVATIFAGVVGIYSGFNFQWLGPWLLGGLLILIGIGIAGIVGLVTKRAEYAIGIAASVFWVVYMMYDFNKVVDRYGEATWPAAMEIAMNLYLDIINFLIRILPYVLDALDNN